MTLHDRLQRALATALLGLLAVLTLSYGRARGEQRAEGSAWESAIAAFEQQDRMKPPPTNGIVFVGSSSIRLWDLTSSFPGLDAINRGFGGSMLADSVRFAPRIVIKYEPRIVVLYAGENDIAFGKSPEQVYTDFRAFAKIVHARLPRTRIVFISIKPSPLRWSQVDKMRRANALIEAHCKTDQRLRYVDVATRMLNENGKPRAGLFRGDGLHLNAKGYELWASVLKPLFSAASERGRLGGPRSYAGNLPG